MPTGTILSVTNLPELLFIVCKHLDSCDIASLMATCKTLARDLEPYLWEHLSIRSKTPSKEALLRNRYCIRELCIESFRAGTCLQSHAEECLKTLTQDLHFEEPDERQTSSSGADHESHIIKLCSIEIQGSPSKKVPKDTVAMDLFTICRQSYQWLSTLRIPAWVLETSSSHHLLAKDNPWRSLPNLNQLEIGYGSSAHLEKVTNFLTGCFCHPRLTTVHCNFYLTGRISEEGLMDMLRSLKTQAELMTDSRISKVKDLRLPWITGGYSNSFLHLFLEMQGPNLERMGVPIAQNVYGREFVQVVEKHCRNVRHLSAAWDYGGWDDGTATIAVIHGCRQAGLQSYYSCLDLGDDAPLMGDTMVKSLIKYHAGTLESVEFARGECSIENQFLILESCKNLKRMWIAPETYNAHPILDSYQIADWPCHGLTELCLTYDRGLTQDFPRKKLYQQIGGLVNLEHLAIKTWAREYGRDLDLQDGWLAMLAGLKKLRRLDIGMGLWSWMEQGEVEFMDVSWPVLQRVSVECSEGQFEMAKEQAHWRWMRERRPWLQFARGWGSERRRMNQPQ